jgi:hypothetical protein
MHGDKRSIGAFNEWGRLREVVIGIEDETVEPQFIPALVWLDEQGKEYTQKQGGKRTADIAPEIVVQLREQLDNHARLLEGEGVRVHRAPPLRHLEEHNYFTEIQQGTMLFGAADYFRFFGSRALLLNSFRMPFRRKQVFMTRPLLDSLLEGTEEAGDALHGHRPLRPIHGRLVACGDREHDVRIFPRDLRGSYYVRLVAASVCCQFRFADG